MRASHPTTGIEEILFVGHDAHIMPPIQMYFAEKAVPCFKGRQKKLPAEVLSASPYCKGRWLEEPEGIRKQRNILLSLI